MGKRKKKTHACNSLQGFPETASQQASPMRDGSASGYFRVQVIVLSDERRSDAWSA
jgi:hypothetical protein